MAHHFSLLFVATLLITFSKCLAATTCSSRLSPSTNVVFQDGLRKVVEAAGLQSQLCEDGPFDCAASNTVDRMISLLTQARGNFISVVDAYNAYLGNAIIYPYSCPTVPLQCSCSLIADTFSNIDFLGRKYNADYSTFDSATTDCNIQAGNLRNTVIGIVCQVEVIVNSLTVCALVCRASTCATTATIPVIATTTVPFTKTSTMDVFDTTIFRTSTVGTTICARPLPTYCCRRDNGRARNPVLRAIGAAKHDKQEEEAANLNMNAATMPHLIGSKSPRPESGDTCIRRRVVVANDD